MVEEEINNKREEAFLELLEETKKINSIWDVYNFEKIEKKSNNEISEKIYIENFLMSSILDSFLYRESLNLKEILDITFNQKVPKYFFEAITINKIYITIIEMIKLGYIELYQKEELPVPIFQLTDLGITTLQQRTLQNLALTSFYSYQSHKLNQKAITLSLIALFVSILAIIISVIIE